MRVDMSVANWALLLLAEVPVARVRQASPPMTTLSLTNVVQVDVVCTDPEEMQSRAGLLDQRTTGVVGDLIFRRGSLRGTLRVCIIDSCPK